MRLPFVRQYAPHLYGNTFGKILGVGVTGTFLTITASKLIAEIVFLEYFSWSLIAAW